MSGKTYYFDIEVPADTITLVAGSFNGTCNKEVASIDEIQWMYNFRKKFFSITKNGKYKLADYEAHIEKCAAEQGLIAE